MSVDTVFQPKAPTVLVSNSAIQAVSTGIPINGMVSFRVVNLAATTQRLGWAPTAAAANAAGPVGAGIANQVYSLVMQPNSIETFEFPVSSFFIASTATGFELTPGQGS